MNYTPGPWKVQKLNSGSVAGTIPVTTENYGKSITNPGSLICSVCGTSKTQADTARLIAAAPELYEALEELRDKVWRIIDLHRVPEARAEADMALERANAALALARGEEENA